MRLLLIHADKFEYETKEQAVKEPEPLSDHGKKGGLQDGLVSLRSSLYEPGKAGPGNQNPQESGGEACG